MNSHTASVADIVRVRARKHPDKVALIHGEQKLTFRELDDFSDRIAQGLLGSGLRPGDRVGVLDRSSIFVIAAALASFKAGLTFAGLNWRLTPRELEYQLTDADLNALFLGPDYREVGREIAAQLPNFRLVHELNDDLVPDADWLAQWSDVDPNGTALDGQPAILLYSSGTTGRPKGVMLGRDGLLGILPGGTRWGFAEDGVNLVNLPLFHIGGIGWSLLGLYHGNTSVVARDATAEDLTDLIENHGVTNAFLVPTLIQMVIESEGFTPDRVQSLRTVVYGGAPITPELLRRAQSLMPCEFAGSYGLTETTNGITTLPPSQLRDPETAAKRLASVGQPHDGVKLRVCDPTTGEILSAGVDGEIQVQAPQNMLGYWRRPEATAETIEADNWVKTGDVGHLDEEGFLYLSDRIADMIISGGENIYPAEVEAAIAEHPGVAQVAVVGLPHPKWGETPVAFVVPAPPARDSLVDEVLAHCRANLAGYKNPTRIVVVDALPLTATGKIAKTELRQVAESPA